LFTASNVRLKLLISRAYGVAEAQIEGGPRWIDTDAWDIEARADTRLEMTREQVRPCLQALLAERFQLTIHRETKQGAFISLAVAKSGSKLKEHGGPGASAVRASSGDGKVSITGVKATMARLAEYVAAQAGRPVVDNTGLRGNTISGWSGRWTMPIYRRLRYSPPSMNSLDLESMRNDCDRPRGKGFSESGLSAPPGTYVC
jgi:uncharacterized protein (TIGR03435 family)